jgi:hypothetical protein
MSELYGKSIPSDKFSFRDNIFVAMMSDLGITRWHEIKRGKLPVVGFTMRSVKTGNVVNFYVHKVNYSSEQEIVSWTLYPTTEALNQYPKLRNVSVEILND